MRVFIYSFALLVCAFSARPATYFTIDQANKQIFPEADSFTKKTELYSVADRRAIAARSKVKSVPNGNRVWVAQKEGRVIGLVILDYTLGKHENIDYAVGITAEGRVKQVEIMAYREAYGFEIRREHWRKQFVGKNSQTELRLHRDIDNIGGATISCRNVSEGVRRLLATFELVLRKSLIADK